MEHERKMIDCRWFPSETKCTLAISGEEKDVIKAAVEHSVSCHAEADTPELREEIREMLRVSKD